MERSLFHSYWFGKRNAASEAKEVMIGFYVNVRTAHQMGSRIEIGAQFVGWVERSETQQFQIVPTFSKDQIPGWLFIF